VTLLAFAADRRVLLYALLLRHRCCAAIDRYLLPAEPTAANVPHNAAAVDSWDTQTDGRTSCRYIDPAARYASRVS